MESPSHLSKANTTFCLDLFRQLSDKDKSANVFYSPFSISSALAMVMLGARGNTATQMSETLCFIEKSKPEDKQQQQQQRQQQQQPQLDKQQILDDVHAKFNELLKELNKADAPYALSVANRLYGEKSFEFIQDYLELTKKLYEAELESVDFRSNHEAARLNINTWVEKQTNGKIKDLLAMNSLSSMTNMVLINAIYFKGTWLKPFDKTNTKDEHFRINKNETKPVKMMHMNDTFNFREVVPSGIKVLELPYKGRELSMIILLPRDIDDSSTGLEQLEKDLTWETFTEWTQPNMMSGHDVEVTLPQFKLEESYSMKDHLVKMGMVDPFSLGESDFSGMSPSSDVALSAVVHKAFVEVNEEGTEAAAATAAIMVLGCALRPRGTFKADHPFLFYIRHNPSGTLLFSGRFCSPV